MIDIQLLRENPELVAQKSAQKQVNVDTKKLLELDEQYREMLQSTEKLRQERNEISDQMKGGKPEPELIEKGKQIKQALQEIEEQLDTLKAELNESLKKIPNLAMDHVPIGETEEDNVVEYSRGEKPKFSFEPKTHWEILESRGMLDKERAAKISGSRFVYLKGSVVQLQFAIMQWVMDKLSDTEFIQELIDENNLNISAKPFTPILPPQMLRTEPYQASARLNAEEVTYGIEQDDLWLNASAEHTLCTMYWNEILPAEELPIRYIGYATSFRREAGTYGKDTEGIIRLHQFDKLEMEIFSSAASGFDEHKLAIAIQEKLVQSLGLHYNFVRKSTADIGKPNAAGIDIDCWFAGQQRYIETHTADYMTDYQARDLNVRTKIDGQTELVHTNDATAFALSRILAAIVEHYQNEDMSISTPEVLKPYLGGRERL